MEKILFGNRTENGGDDPWACFSFAGYGIRLYSDKRLKIKFSY